MASADAAAAVVCSGPFAPGRPSCPGGDALTALAEERRAYLDRTKGFADSMQKGAQDMLQTFQQMEEGAHQTRKQVFSRA